MLGILIALLSIQAGPQVQARNALEQEWRDALDAWNDCVLARAYARNIEAPASPPDDVARLAVDRCQESQARLRAAMRAETPDVPAGEVDAELGRAVDGLRRAVSRTIADARRRDDAQP